MAVRVNANTDDILYTAGTIGEGAFTAMMWFYLAVDRNDFSNIFWIGDDVYAEDGCCDLFLDGDGVSISCGIRNYSTPQVSLAEALVVGNWYHLCVSGSTATSQPFNLRVYRLSNNTQNTYSGTSGTLGTWPAGAAGKIQLLMTSAGSGAVWANARGQAFKIWNGVTLTADQIAWERWFINPVFEVSNCYAAWPLLYETDTRDLSGNGRSPSLTGLQVEDGPPLFLAAGGKRLISRANPAAAGGTVNTEVLDSLLTMFDQAVYGVARGRVADDSVATADETLVGAVRGRLLTDDLTITDEALASVIGQAIFTRILESFLVVSDGAIVSATRGRIAQDSIIVSEPSIDSFVNTNIVATDELEVTDQALRYILFRRLMGDDVTVSDDYIASVIGQNILARVLTSNMTVTDEALWWMDRYRIGESNILTSDQVRLAVNYTRDLISQIDAIDSAGTALQRFILLTDTLSVNDSFLSTIFTPTTDAPLIRIGFDQPRIDVGGYGLN